MLYRSMFMSQLKPETKTDFLAAFEERKPVVRKWLAEQRVAAFAAYELDGILCVYLEAEEEVSSLEWPDGFKEHLAVWPGRSEGRSAVRMPDIFHDGMPLDAGAWREGRAVARKVGSLARIKPDMFASYVFYHFQMQEEVPESFNKTYTIGTYDAFIFSYHELPESFSERKPAGLLRTRNTPGNWGAVMLPHFEPWPDATESERLWRIMEPIYFYE